MFVQTLQDFEKRIHVNTSLFSREPQLYKRVRLSIDPSVCCAFAWRAETSWRATYLEYTNLI